MQTDTVTTFLARRLDDFLADLNTIVSMDSFSPDRDDVNRVVDWLESRLRGLGFAAERYLQVGSGDDLLATRRGTGKGRIVLLGHSDTVFPHGTARQRPMSAQGDKILGPGTCDMKGGLITGVYAIEVLNQLGFTDYEQITYLCVSDEEVDFRHSIPLIRSTCRHADAVLTLEAARENGDIVIARKGVFNVYAEAHGHAAHAGVEPEKGRNAIMALLHQAMALNQLNDAASDVTVNIGVIEGGRLSNVIPDHAAFKADVRAYTPDELERLKAQVQAIFQREPVPGVHFDVSIEDNSPPMPRTPKVAALEAMTVQIARELGFTVKGAQTGGAGDAAFAAAEGAPVLDGLGPVGGLDHGPDEYILKSSLVPRTALLAQLIMAIGQKENQPA
jgi:glutamate carboxypeptidase